MTAGDRIAMIVADTNDRKTGSASAMRQIEVILQEAIRDAAAAERDRIRQRIDEMYGPTLAAQLKDSLLDGAP